ncbi:MAG: dTDP-glucose 4,6-dehydratase [Pelagibacteraceae bacterium]|jgi:dTDP-glucose 4,6-dehydratase|nr:dTDP-glucose 4,6-dehydratase [Pelagibacteraceae bacterium]
MKKIVVTGGSGFIGSNLVKFLLKKDYFVINIDKLGYSANPYNLKRVTPNKNYRFFKQDINNKSGILKILNRFKPIGIFNLAAETHVDRSIDAPETFIKSNILGVYHLLVAVDKYLKKNRKKIKLVHISTDEVYGDIETGKRSNEKFSYNPSSPYSASKASADHLIKSFVRTYKLPIVISNCCNNYGPNQFPEKLIPKLIYNIINNKPMPIYGKGRNSREWIHVQDHCKALLKIFLRGKVGESYNVGSNHNIQNIDVARKLLGIAKKNSFVIGNKVKIIFVKDRPGHDFRYALDSNKMRRKLKWKSKINLNVGLAHTFKWYLNNMKFFTSVARELYDKRLGLK